MMSEKHVHVGLVQMSCSSDTRQNLEKALNGIERAAEKGAQIVCLQELFRSLYFCDVEDHDRFSLAESIPGGESVEACQKIAQKLGVVVIASLFEKRAQGLYHNTISVLDADGRYLGKYRKSHIPDDPGYYEKFYFTPGDTGYRVFDTRFGRIGTLICWDQWYPEAARITSLMGAEILFYPTAIGWNPAESSEVHQDQYHAWKTIQTSHAIANGVHVVSVNRVGVENGMKFWGGSFISNPFGRTLYSAPHDEEVVHVEKINLNESDFYRTHWPFLRDRRIDTYAPILQRYIEDPRVG